MCVCVCEEKGKGRMGRRRGEWRAEIGSWSTSTIFLAVFNPAWMAEIGGLEHLFAIY